MSNDTHGMVDVVFGGQAGSEGKGKVAGYLVIRRENYGLAVADFSPNAGHTWKDEDKKVVVQQVPMSLVRPDIHLAISPGAVLDPTILLREIEEFGIADRIIIDPRACVVTERHRSIEAKTLERISSTLKGSGAALADKVVRHPEMKLARDLPELAPFMGNVNELIMKTLADGLDVMLEGAQGFDLDIDHGLQYPYCTSRHTTPMAIASRACVPHNLIREVWAVCRTYPIRVGNTYDAEGRRTGYSGDYADSSELTWPQIAERAGMAKTPKEITTVTGKTRRVFEFSFNRFKHMCAVTGVTDVAMNFIDYIDPEVYGVDEYGIIQNSKKCKQFIESIHGAMDGTDAQLTFIGTGPHDEHAVSSHREY